MSQRYSTAGMMLVYAVEQTKGVRPTSGYILIPEVKSMPSFNPAPDTIDSTTLLETEYRTYVEGLKDLGGSLEYTANLTADLITVWEACVAAHDAAALNDKATWFAVVHPKLAKAVFFEGDPSPLGLNEASVGSMAETTLYVTPNSAPTWYAKPSITETGNTNLAALMVGTNLLTPYFNSMITEYTAETTNSSDVIVAAAEDESASIAIASSDATISTNTATWAPGENVVTVTVTNGGASKVYTLTVTKS